MTQSMQETERRSPAMQSETSIWIAATPKRVYDLIADVTKLGRLSPECYRCEWDEGVTAAAVGATFTGYDRVPGQRWSTRCRVFSADPPWRFAFATGTDTDEFSRWTYHLTPVDGGTRVTESFVVHTVPPALRDLGPDGLAARTAELHDGMVATLARLKAAVEARPMMLGPGEGTPFPGSTTLTLKDDQGADGRAFSTLIIDLPELGGGPPAHRHRDDDEAFYVLEGTVRFDVGGRIVDGTPGSFFYVPRGTVGTFGNLGPGPARMFCVTTANGRDFLWDLQHLFATGTDDEELADLDRRYGIERTDVVQ